LHLQAGVIAHHFTIDLEEYFQVSAFESCIARCEWDRFESRVAAEVARLLDLLARHEARATFFVLGWVAERQADLIRTIARAGHEIASHGWDHTRVTHQTPRQFRDSIRHTKDVLEEISGAPVLGFRAPSFSIVPGWEWALDILIEEGYHYDSSLFPVRRPGYGYPNGLPHPHWLERPAGRLAEIPPTTLHWCGLRLPAAGGAYFRLLPYGVVRAALQQCERSGVPGTFYIHPWEIDPAQPRLDVSWLTRVRHYGGLWRTAGRLERLLAEFRFTAVRDSVFREPAAAAAVP
jgi:polysaccharide deacetylase family protein (PEP-CTERM system associated)